MQEKIEKAKLHRVISTGTMEHIFEVLCKDRTGRGICRDRVVQESLITVDGKAFCSCMKPKLLHLPCSANASLWLTTAVLVYDITVEAYCPWRVRRQFGQRQEFPVPTALERVSPQDHR